MPWKNSWFQLAALVAVICGGLLIYDFGTGGFSSPVAGQSASVPSHSTPPNQTIVPPIPADKPPPIVPPITAPSVPIPASQPLATDSPEASKYRAAAVTGDVDAARNLGYIYLMGGDYYGVPQNIDEALKWIQYAAGKEDIFSLGLEYQYGLGQEKDAAKAVGLYQDRAAKGDVLAQNQLAGSYGNGLGVERDDAQALNWYKKAAEQNYAPAAFQLGSKYENGQGAAKDINQALSWYQKAAEGGNAAAQLHLGLIYLEGLGVTKDYSQALAWLQKAADQGVPLAQYEMGCIYQYGWGAAIDYSQALAWFKKADAQGYVLAAVGIGNMYFSGQGVGPDSGQALIWYQKAADQGNISGQNHLANMYENGYGAPKDINLAVKWYKKSAAAGDAEAQAAVTRLQNMASQSAAPAQTIITPPDSIPHASPVPPAESSIYTVEKGDTLWKIAHKMYPNDTMKFMEKIKQANKDSMGQAPLKVGQILIIPANDN